MKPETQAAIAAEMCRMMGWTHLHPVEKLPFEGTPPGGSWPVPYNPWICADDAIAFADWAERERWIDGWHKVGHYTTITCGEYGHKIADCAITPTTPFPHALSLAVSRAVPELREILEAEDAE